jgi:KDO2-lipid IV(A) lauroyltransferase
MPATTPKTEIRRAARQIVRNVSLYYVDLIRMPHMDLDQFTRERVVLRGLVEHLAPAAKSGRGVIILGAHSGNPELAVQGVISFGIHVLALTEPLDPPSLSRLLDRLRESKGHTFYPVGVAGVKQVVKSLRGGGVVALMGDRDIRGPKAALPFLDAETLMPTGPIEVALRTGAVVIPAFSRRSGKYVVEAHLGEPLRLERTGDLEKDARLGTLQFIERLERHLRTDPAQWAVLESIWDAPAESPRKGARVLGRTA